MAALAIGNSWPHRLPARKTLVATVLALYAAAFVFHTGWFLAMGGRLSNQFELANDETEYEGLAKQIRRGTYNQTEMNQGRRELPAAGKPTAFRTPGYPVMLAGIYSVVGENPGAARVVMLLLTSLLPGLTYLLAFRLYGRQGLAVVLGALAIFMPCSVRNAGWLLPEDITTVLFVGSVLLLIWAVTLSTVRKPLVIAAASGLLVGLCILSRGFLLFVPAALAIWLLMVRRTRLAMVFFVASTLLPTGWILRNTVTFGMFSMSTETPEVIWLGHNPWARGSWPGNWKEQRMYLLKRFPHFDSLDEIGQARVFGQEARREIVENPKRVLWLIPRKVALFFSPKSYLGIDWPLLISLPFFVIGTVVLWRDRERRHLLVLAGLPVVAVLLINVMAYADVRHRHPIEPLILIVSGAGMVHALNRVRGRLPSRLAGPPTESPGST